ncbi:carboxyl transferase domain-containing protein [Mariniblastus fucicola]|uniref:carboxyl transferase domain-containing protein n=1 Tax=Mariniblastus fucicola TaxID=980251 RepID=UPI0011DFF4EA|nr:carboxyl transferase domain-containing protein [Mariniblastus fucicola]
MDITIAAMRRAGNQLDAKEMEALREKVESSHDETTDIRHTASHLWVDGFINPQDTRNVLISALEAVTQRADDEPFRTGVLQVRKLLNPLATNLRLADASQCRTGGG